MKTVEQELRERRKRIDQASAQLDNIENWKRIADTMEGKTVVSYSTDRPEIRVSSSSQSGGSQGLVTLIYGTTQIVVKDESLVAKLREEVRAWARQRVETLLLEPEPRSGDGGTSDASRTERR